MFKTEQQSRKAILTLQDGSKIQAIYYFPKQNKPMFYKEMERKFIEKFNEQQPHAVNKVISVHIMRN